MSDYSNYDSSIHPKVAASLSAGGLITAVTGLLAVFGVVIPSDVSDAALAAWTAGTVLVTFIAGYLKSA